MKINCSLPRRRSDRNGNAALAVYLYFLLIFTTDTADYNRFSQISLRYSIILTVQVKPQRRRDRSDNAALTPAHLPVLSLYFLVLRLLSSSFLYYPLFFSLFFLCISSFLVSSYPRSCTSAVQFLILNS